MEYTKLGNTGLDVSRLCLGCMGFGVKERWMHPWVIDEESSRTVIKKAIELGINFLDTANVYSDGTSEEFLGRALKEFSNRDEIVVATKVYFPLGNDLNSKGPNSIGLSRKHIMSE